MKPLIVIPARKGSKGVPGKNIKKLGGKPLILHTVDAARHVFDDDLIIVSTDSEEIKQCVETAGLSVPFLRPEVLASDEAGTYEVLLHALDFVEGQEYFPDTLILLQPTSPFRTSKHIKEALELYDGRIEMVVSVKETRSNPYYVLFEEDDDGFLRNSKKGTFTTRQSCPKVWEYNGAIYIINVAALKSKRLNEFTKIKKYVMEELPSHDIDTPMDWKIAESVVESGLKP